jgi:hypothetical protein
MADSSSYGDASSRIDPATQYRLAFETWKLYVSSYWQQNAYFAAVDGAAIVAAWRLMGHRSAIALCSAGCALAVLWIVNNRALESSIRHWSRAIAEIERAHGATFPLFADYPRSAQRSFARVSSTLDLIPVLFLLGWVWLAIASVHALNATHALGAVVAQAPFQGSLRTSPLTLPQNAQDAAQTANRSSVEQPLAVDRPAGQAAQPEATSASGQESAPTPEGYARLATPNNFYAAGLTYAVDSEGNRYTVADLVREAGLKTYSVPPPYTSLSAIIHAGEIEQTIDANSWGDLVSRVLFVVQSVARKQNTAPGDVQLKVVNVEARRTDLENASQAVRQSPFWRQHGEMLQGLRLFLVAETISSKRIVLDFPNTHPEVLKQAFAQLSELGSDTFVPQSPTAIGIMSRLPLILDCKSVDLDAKSYSQNGRATLSPVKFERLVGHRGAATFARVSVHPPLLETIPLQPTHFADSPPLVPIVRHETYGAILDQLKQKILAAGISEMRIYDSGYGFALATRFEVTDNDGVPLPGNARFLPRQAQGKRLRGYYITVTAHPRPTAYVSTHRPQDLFTMRYGLTYLPNDMDQIPVEPGTSVKVFVLEFENKAGTSREISAQECPFSAQVHMKQSGLTQ